MIYADTDFFVALLKKSDWLKSGALKLFEKHHGSIWTSPATLIELLLIAAEFDLDPEELLVDVLKIADLRHGEPNVFLVAAGFIKNQGATVFDSVHAAYCGSSKIISSDRVFDRLGLDRIPLTENDPA